MINPNATLDCNTTERLTLQISEAAKVLGCSPSLLYKLANNGELPFILRLGNRLIVSKHLLEKYLAGGYEGATND